MKKYLIKTTLVWLIVIAGVVIFSAFTFIIGTNQGRLLGSYKFYKTQLLDVSGLSVGSKVNIHGARTGNISEVEVLADGLIELTFSVKKAHLLILNSSSVVEMKNSGALGDRYINIITEDFLAPKIKAGSLIPYKKSSNLLSFFTEGGKKSKDSIQNILKQVESVLNQVNEKGIIDILSKEDKKELSEILKNANQLLKSSHQILKKIESGQGALGALINDPSLYNRILVLLGERSKNNYLEELSSKK